MPVYAFPCARPRCLVCLLDLVLSFRKFPAKAKELDLFYLQPVSKIPASSEAPWCVCVHVSRDKLSKFVSTMCQEAGCTPKANHSVPATEATALNMNASLSTTREWLSV